MTSLAAQPAAAPAPATSASAPQVLSLDDCLRITFEKNHRRPASRFAVAIAEAQHRQALAGYWPQVNAKAGWFRMDEAPNFVFPASNMYIPSQTVTVPGGSTSVTIPANAFGPGFPPVAVQMPVSFPGQSITTNAQVFPVPEQDVKLMDPQSVTATGNFTWLLFDGGMRSGYRQQALGGKMAAQAELRRTDLELTDSVVRLYYGAVLARQLHQLGQDTLARMEVTLELTESLYKNGAGRVNKTDYLDNVVMVETIRSTVAELAKNEAAAQAALAYTMGLPWDATVVPSSEEVPHRPFAGNAAELVSSAYEFNPDWAKVEAGLKALDGAVSTARSGYYPKIALTGEVHRWWNDYTTGTATTRNKTGWTIGAGAEIPIFDGFLTKNRVSEALARVAKLKEEKLLLREGIGLQVRELFLSLEAASKTYQAAERAMVAARENRELTSRAYQNELVDTEKVIRAQLFEALMSAQFYKTRYDHVAIESQLSVVIGKEVRERITSKP
ncbi:TolC family protein [Paludibaculum fermentans]|uniref:TolC family protein n=2 Tax=Paludibaculum fermentans TaxID=1473598 RepID=A0A7S7NY51_PALFE|nr:TolC family protein [Paludibaculum fermentans]